jgi:hypothetical protein
MAPEEFYPLVESIIIASANEIVRRYTEFHELPERKWLRFALMLRHIGDKAREAGKKHPLLPSYDFVAAADLTREAARDIRRFWPDCADHLDEIELLLRDIPRADVSSRAPIGVKSAVLTYWECYDDCRDIGVAAPARDDAADQGAGAA